MITEDLELCKIKDTNQFWTHYLFLEKELQEISDYVAINVSNEKTFSFKIMQLYLIVCTDIDSIFKYIQSNLGITKPKNGRDFTITDHIKMLNEHFPLIKDITVELKFSGQVLEFIPFKYLFIRIIDENYEVSTWWNDYTSVKHHRLDSFDKASLNNLLNSLAALHILNLVYGVSSRHEWRENYTSILIEAPAITHYPIFQLKNSSYDRRIGGKYGLYFSSLNN